jgi:hypothetical protein
MASGRDARPSSSLCKTATDPLLFTLYNFVYTRNELVCNTPLSGYFHSIVASGKELHSNAVSPKDAVNNDLVMLCNNEQRKFSSFVACFCFHWFDGSTKDKPSGIMTMLLRGSFAPGHTSGKLVFTSF